MTQCDVKFCRQERTLGYLGKGVCDKHYEQHCEGKINLKTEFGLI